VVSQLQLLSLVLVLAVLQLKLLTLAPSLLTGSGAGGVMLQALVIVSN
jgi:hypothetical protein